MKQLIMFYTKWITIGFAIGFAIGYSIGLIQQMGGI
jgi:hypothetical protein|tara:strand:- start:698 stop:805 length:108 start_codon:yes stop_codon:yes gene_type:complete